ncbi:MAG TPA: C45 family autoproteolytic acyltransferase/hydrolase [Aliidongia sp.]|uniref:C45 family autoproteolytic acyltransferase/hydolase n=1 Tax=Aliidongia sp. TaxID=1914230 RepID=UPI002DDD6E3C|nr:C45 family autoproteolytic acyltransferase/hydolase [Aliidongia sp.]HEV2677868.1 C45 family autoproteolytic acyltransferase/hydrolase [Aliidongia sp.]
MQKRFVFDREDRPGEAWAARFAAGRDEARRWYQGQRRADPPSAADCRAALLQHMPELVPAYDRACALVGGDELAPCLLSHYRPAPTAHGCSQAIWLGSGGPALIRNYDFALDMVSERFELTSWSGRRIIAKAQRPWGGCIDGMNEVGLVAALNYGGSAAQGLGFSVILMLRYVLETCSRVDEAVAALCRIPIALSQNVVLLDRTGAHAILFLGPGRSPAVSRTRVCTNHQEPVVEPASAALAHSLGRERHLQAALDDPAMTLPDLIALFLQPPLHSRRAASTTAYTAVYRPAEGRVDYLWPGAVRRQSFDQFMPGEYLHDYALTS